jgi:hypothetical protein
MWNPFEIGGTYRNRKGEYEVVELDGPRMVICYTNGERRETGVELQARILTNMQAERAARKRQAARKAAHKSRHSGAARIHFDGLVDADFQHGTAGTNWRARTSLGGLLAERLSVRTNRQFRSQAIFRRAEAHIAQPEHYDKKTSPQQAKFVFLMGPDSARYGLYIEKNSGPMDKNWHWPNLMAALGSNKALQKQALAAMRRLCLQWETYSPPGEAATARVTAGEDGLRWQPEEGEAETVPWEGFVQRLTALDEDTWCDLYLWTATDKNEAIAAGSAIADRAVEVYGELLPLYDAAVGA